MKSCIHEIWFIRHPWLTRTSTCLQLTGNKRMNVAKHAISTAFHTHTYAIIIWYDMSACFPTQGEFTSCSSVFDIFWQALSVLQMFSQMLSICEFSEVYHASWSGHPGGYKPLWHYLTPSDIMASRAATFQVMPRHVLFMPSQSHSSLLAWIS